MRDIESKLRALVDLLDEDDFYYYEDSDDHFDSRGSHSEQIKTSDRYTVHRALCRILAKKRAATYGANDFHISTAEQASTNGAMDCII